MEAVFHPDTPRRGTLSTSNWGLIAALTVVVSALALCLDRVHNNDLYLLLAGGRFISEHGLVNHDPFPTIAHGGLWLNQQWLTEVGFFRAASLVGLNGLSILYAVLLAAPLMSLLWLCRHKGPGMLVAIAVLYFPGALAVIHPRAAGFSLLIFSLLVVLITLAWRSRQERARRQWVVFASILGLFALWANLHGGFVAGLLLIALVCVGAAIDSWRRLPGAVQLSRILVLGSIGALAVAVDTVATPLGDQIWSYLLSFQNTAISLVTQEWLPAFQSPLAIIYLAVAAAFSAVIWLRSPRSRRATTPLVVLGFIAFAAFAIRNTVFIGPIVAFVVAWSAPDRKPAPLRLPVAAFGSAAVLGVLVVATMLGPPRDDPLLDNQVVDYAIAHPPAHGRILGYAGMGSYILWRSPHTPVVVDGWLEHFASADLRANYGVLNGTIRDLRGAAKRLQVGAVIARRPKAIRRLEANGYSAEFTSFEGTYLVRGGLSRAG